MSISQNLSTKHTIGPVYRLLDKESENFPHCIGARGWEANSGSTHYPTVDHPHMRLYTRVAAVVLLALVDQAER